MRGRKAAAQEQNTEVQKERGRDLWKVEDLLSDRWDSIRLDKARLGTL
jgi:hypothetical protein